jgi:hypothetical protein
MKTRAGAVTSCRGVMNAITNRDCVHIPTRTEHTVGDQCHRAGGLAGHTAIPSVRLPIAGVTRLPARDVSTNDLSPTWIQIQASG